MCKRYKRSPSLLEADAVQCYRYIYMPGFFRHFAAKPPFGHRVAKAASISAMLVLAFHFAFVIQFIVSHFDDLQFLRLHYATGIGVDWIDRWWYLFVFPFLGLATLAINLWFATILARRKIALGVMIVVATTVLEILFAASGLIAVLLNG